MLQSNQPITGTILVADDQVANRELFHELLTSHGFLIPAAADGAEALRQVEKGNVDLALLDVMMPHFNGLEVCEKIKSNPETYLLPVILVTALSEKQDRIDGIKAGAHVIEPFRANNARKDGAPSPMDTGLYLVP